MLKELFIITVIGLNLSGCTLVHKSQTKIVKVLAAAVEQPAGEKVWVEAQTNKVWVNPHVDENGDMVEGHYKHIVITPGHWAVKDDGKK